jgi:hypothetical protein|nr:MAG TPA: hypothetical protein [Caudoviricetes sp.]
MIFGSDGGKWYGDDYYGVSYHIELNKNCLAYLNYALKRQSVLFAYTTTILKTF